MVADATRPASAVSPPAAAAAPAASAAPLTPAAPMTKDAAFAQAKLDAALNPGVEVVREDYASGALQTRDKKTGQVTTLRFDPGKGQMMADAARRVSAVSPPAAPAASAAPLTKDAAFAQAKLDATLNPGVEVVREDYASGTLQTRDKKTGQVTTLRFDPSRGQMVADASRVASAVSLPAAAPPAARSSPPARSPAAAASSVSLPSWIPSYPRGTLLSTSVTPNGEGGHVYSALYSTSSDPPRAIVEYYRSKLEASGFAVTMSNVNDVAEFVELTKGDHKIQVVGALNKSNGQVGGTYTATEQ